MHVARQRLRWTRLAFAAAVLTPAIALTALPGASAAEPASGLVLTYQVQASEGDAGALATELLAAGYDVAGRNGDVLYVLGTDATGADLRARPGVEIVGSEPAVSGEATVDEQPVAGDQDAILPKRLDGKTYETFYGGYRTVDGFQKFEEDLAAAYPTTVQLVEYGKSYTGENPLRAVCITAKADEGCELTPNTDKTRFLFMAQIHARELTTSEMTWRFMTYLLDGKGKSADITALLDDTEIWVVPETNPDGIEAVETGIKKDGFVNTSDAWQRKNLNPGTIECSHGSSSQIGVDLNRNWDAYWGGAGTSPYECSLVYLGKKAASEPETSKLASLFQDLFRDQRGSGANDAAPADTNGAMLTLHTYSNLVLFPYGSGADAPNDAGLRSMAFRMSYYNGYQTGRPNEILYDVTGSTDDFTYKDLGIASFTYEIGPGSGTCGGFHPAYSCQDDFWNLNRDGFMYNAVAAQQPYTQALGPTVLGAAARLDGKVVRITGTADDDAYGNFGVDRPTAQKVTDARLFVGKAPWEGGKAKPVTIKGSGTEVDLEASLKAKTKEKLVYLQAKDADGNWGPVEVVWRKAA